VCVPSRREGYGMTAREAMAYGRPVVATQVGGLADLGAGATLVDAGGLGAAVASLLGDPAHRRRLGAAAREEAQASFSSRVAAECLLDSYRAVHYS
jgi:glycosyltransferase involved in cell wall biosynthesis